MAFAWRGVVEGFYGKAWSHAERLDALAWMGSHGFGAYLYAPKDDPLHRARWREPYPPEAMARFSELVRAGERHGVEVIIAISPGLSLVHSLPVELEVLWEKLEAFRRIGVRTFGVFFDDIPSLLVHEEDRRAYGSLAAAQADFATRLWERMDGHGLRLIVCPTHYCGDPDVPYLQELGRSLAPDIDLMWTGPTVCSREITTAHVAGVARAMRRPPVLWDNYPVNDGHMAAELHIGPYTGRDPTLDAVSRGIFANPMNQPVASRLPLACIGRYLRDPASYDPTQAWRDAVEEMVGSPGDVELVEAFALFARLVRLSPLHPEEPEWLVSLFRRFQELTGSLRFEEGMRALQDGMTAMREAKVRLAEASRKVPILADCAPWIEDLGRWLDVLETALDLISAEGALWTGSPDERGAAWGAFLDVRRRLGQKLKEAVDWPTRTCGDTVRAFAQDLYRRTGFRVQESPSAG